MTKKTVCHVIIKEHRTDGGAMCIPHSVYSTEDTARLKLMNMAADDLGITFDPRLDLCKCKSTGSRYWIETVPFHDIA